MKTHVSSFYDQIQFPGFYSQKEIIKKSQDFFLSPYLKIAFLPFKGKILDAGCGTGYTTHIIANLRTDVEIKGIDFAKNSVEYASNFSQKHDYKNTQFSIMDLKNINMKENEFDLIHCSGVLHHIENPKPIFIKLCKLLKKNGVFIIGLYHPWGRFSTHVRQKIFKITQNKIRWIDPRIRNEGWSQERKITWFRDQYEHPHEKDYSHKILNTWFEEEGISVIGSLPNFERNNLNYNFLMLTQYGSQGGLYIFVGQKE